MLMKTPKKTFVKQKYRKTHYFLNFKKQHIYYVYFSLTETLKKTPPDISKDLNHLLAAYESRNDYFTIVMPHLLLETWESVRMTCFFLTSMNSY